MSSTSKMSDHIRPSIFVLLAEESLHTTLRRSIRLLLKLAISNRSNPVFKWLEERLDELQLAVEVAIECPFLAVHRATFSEQFMWLERSSNSRVGTTLARLVQVCGLPYLQDRLESCHAQLIDRRAMLENVGQLEPQSFTIWEKRLLAYNGYLNKLLTSIQVLGWIIYVSSSSTQHWSHSLSLWTLGDQLCYKTNRAEGVSMAHRLTKLIEYSLKSLTFVVQFLQYYYSRPGVPQSLSRSSDHKIVAPSFSSSELSSSTCPLCLASPRAHPTVLSSSGFVFCYVCIKDYLREHGRCPVSGLPSSSGQLIRLFD